MNVHREHRMFPNVRRERSTNVLERRWTFGDRGESSRMCANVHERSIFDSLNEQGCMIAPWQNLF